MLRRAIRITSPLALAGLLCACGARSGQQTGGDAGGIPSPRRDTAVAADARVPLPDSAVASDALQSIPLELRACLYALGCGDGTIGGDSITLSECLDRFALRYWYGASSSVIGFGIDQRRIDRWLGCAKEAGCGAFRRCFGGALIGFGSCEPEAVCEGTTMVRHGAQFDCSSIEGACTSPAIGEQMACCRPFSCDDDDVRRCDEQIFCAQSPLGGGFFFDCAPTGRVCREGPIGELCQGTGRPCAEGGVPITCQGPIADYCAPDRGQRATMDCRSTGFRTRCDKTGATAGFPCAPRGQQCDPESYEGACDAEDLLVCVDGFIERVDCDALGFEGCIGGKRGKRCGFYL